MKVGNPNREILSKEIEDIMNERKVLELKTTVTEKGAGWRKWRPNKQTSIASLPRARL